jgi:tRNA threonylcarbamoyladenosine biosynthesis protein TsaE
LTLTKEIISRSPEETFRKGNEYAGSLKPGDIVLFTGPLGSGKTQFIKGICSFFGISNQVNSPTFIIVNEYEGHTNSKYLKINHFDLYRIKSPDELDDIGVESYFSDDSICLVEWGETAEQKFPGARSVVMDYGKGEFERTIRLC